MRQHSNQQVLLKQKENEMWAVQTGITVLKRRLKSLTDVVSFPACSNEKEFNEKIEKPNTLNCENMDDIDETNANLLEKQLIASKLSLNNEICDERKEIVHLLSELREVKNLELTNKRFYQILQLRSQLPEAEQNHLTESQRATNCLSQQKPLKFVLPKHVGRCSNNKQQRNGENLIENINWEQICADEERKNAELLAELIRYRCVFKFITTFRETFLLSLKHSNFPETLQIIFKLFEKIYFPELIPTLKLYFFIV